MTVVKSSWLILLSISALDIMFYIPFNLLLAIKSFLPCFFSYFFKIFSLSQASAMKQSLILSISWSLNCMGLSNCLIVSFYKKI